jgi:hypothetical protein
LSFSIFFHIAFVNADGINVDADVLIVSAGPFCEDCLEGRFLYRVVVTLSEVSLSVFVQKVSYGDENCCKEVIKTFEIDPDKLEGEYSLFSVSDITWKSHDSFFFKGNSVYFLINNLDEEYECIRRTERP